MFLFILTEFVDIWMRLNLDFGVDLIGGFKQLKLIKGKEKW